MSVAEPIWLFLLPVVSGGLALLYAWGSARRKRRLQLLAAPSLLPGLTATACSARRRWKIVLNIVALSLLVLALARPQWGYEWRENRSRGLDIIIAVDVSQSMLAEDLPPTRLERAKLAVRDFVEQLPGDRVGLVAFAGEAFLQCPLTTDYGAFFQTLDTLEAGVIQQGGTDLARAIDAAQAAFGEDVPQPVILLLTDGEDLEASGVERAREAANDGVLICTVGLGSLEGALIPVPSDGGQVRYLRDADGHPVQTKLDEETLRAIATASQGQYVNLSQHPAGLDRISRETLDLLPERELQNQPQRVPIDRFVWPLAAAVLLLLGESLLGERRSPRPASQTLALLIILGLVGLPANAEASRAAREAYQQGHYAEAAELWQEATQSDPTKGASWHALGNSLYQLEQYSEALDAYRHALALTPAEQQGDLLYNMGLAEAQLGEQASANAPSATDLADTDAHLRDNIDEFLSQGWGLVEQGRAARNAAEAPPSLRNEAPPPPQEAIQQTYEETAQRREMSDKLMEEQSTLRNDSNDTEHALQRSRRHWQRARDYFNGAADLGLRESPELQANRDYLDQRIAQTQQDIKTVRQILERDEGRPLPELQTELTELEEALKALLEDPPSEDEQDNEQESQDQNQEQGDDSSTQNQEQGDDQQQNEPDQQGEQNGPDEGDPQQEANDEQDGSQSPSDEEAAPDDASETSSEEAQESEGQTSADAEAQAEGAASSPGEEVEVQLMRRSEAAEILDSLAEQEKVLPIYLREPQPPQKNNQSPQRNW